jgi:predicted glycoside hydrolase/deacetylase ChbG (UPF0249 family)
VRSTNFLVPCPWFHEALALAKAHSLQVGVHLCLTCDWDYLKWGPLTSAPSLRDQNGHFFPRYDVLAAEAREADIFAELDAQILRVKRLGFEPTHLDNHMLSAGDSGGIFDIVRDVTRKLAAKYDLPYTYDVDEKGLRLFREEHCLSPFEDDENWSKLESWTEGGVYHLITHPAVESPELGAMCSETHPARAWTAEYRTRDLTFLTSASTRNQLEKLGFECVSLAEVAQSAKGG